MGSISTSPACCAPAPKSRPGLYAAIASVSAARTAPSAADSGVAVDAAGKVERHGRRCLAVGPRREFVYRPPERPRRPDPEQRVDDQRDVSVGAHRAVEAVEVEASADGDEPQRIGLVAGDALGEGQHPGRIVRGGGRAHRRGDGDARPGLREHTGHHEPVGAVVAFSREHGDAPAGHRTEPLRDALGGASSGRFHERNAGQARVLHRPAVGLAHGGGGEDGLEAVGEQAERVQVRHEELAGGRREAWDRAMQPPVPGFRACRACRTWDRRCQAVVQSAPFSFCLIASVFASIPMNATDQPAAPPQEAPLHEDAAEGSLTVAHVDLGAVRHNLGVIRARSEGANVIGIVKADAYGHGALRIAHTLREEGVTHFAVATVPEGIALREGGIDGDILVFAAPLPHQLPAYARHGLAVTVSSLQVAREIAQSGVPLQAHLKLDTGMHRVGVRAEETRAALDVLRHCDTVEVAGIWTHFATADDDSAASTAFVQEQMRLFQDALAAAAEIGFDECPVHLANSGALCFVPDAVRERAFVRAGGLLYGLPSSPELAGHDDRREASDAADHACRPSPVGAARRHRVVRAHLEGRAAHVYRHSPHRLCRRVAAHALEHEASSASAGISSRWPAWCAWT